VNKLRIAFACGDYDRVAPIKEGTVLAEGVEINFMPMGPEELFFRMARYTDFDVAEMSLASYILHRGAGRQQYVAIPVFPSRAFRHSAIYINTKAGIKKPEDLAGRRVGVPEYQMTAIVWAKGILAEHYGVKTESVNWFAGGQEEPGRQERTPIALPDRFRLQRIANDKTLSGMVDAGELDALIAARTPSPFARGSSNVARLFPNAPEAELAYFKKTGIFPIMHTIVIRGDLHREHPWLAANLHKAFRKAQQVARANLTGAPALPVSLAWLEFYVAQEEAAIGADAWAYGFKKNRAVVETLIRYLVEQGLLERAIDAESLFAPSTLEEAKI
jgi:4,5-dihydroxyphthalate decarboxylase